MTIAITNAMIPKEKISKEMISKATKTIVKGDIDGPSEDDAACGRLENDGDGCAHTSLRWLRRKR